jgi:hypothetical protein
MVPRRPSQPATIADDAVALVLGDEQRAGRSGEQGHGHPSSSLS